MWKNIVVGQVTGDNLEHTHCIQDIQGYNHTLRICNGYCFPTATVVARTLLSVMFYVDGLSSLKEIRFRFLLINNTEILWTFYTSCIRIEWCRTSCTQMCMVAVHGCLCQTNGIWQVVRGGTFIATALRSPPALTKNHLIICLTQQMLC